MKKLVAWRRGLSQNLCRVMVMSSVTCGQAPRKRELIHCRTWHAFAWLEARAEMYIRNLGGI